MHAMTRKTIQINRKGSGKRLTFTRRHFSDGAFMKHKATDHLHIERQHAERLHRLRIEFADLRIDGSRQIDFPFVLPAFEFGLRLVHGVLKFRAEAAKVKAEFRLENVEDTQTAVASFAADRKSLDLDIFERGPISQFFAEFRTFCSKGLIIQRFKSLAGFVNLCNHRAKLLHLAFMRCTKNLMEY